MRCWKSLSLVIVFVLSIRAVAAQSPGDARFGVVTLRDIPYAEGVEAHPRRVLDLYVPDGARNYPLLMFVPGGGWVRESKGGIANIGMAFAERGVAVATVDYRLVPEVTYEGQVEDLARAFVWLRENMGEAQGDTSHIIVGGHSAGAHLVSMLAVNPQYLGALGHNASEISGVIAISGMYRFRQSVIGSGLVPNRPDAVEAISPLTYLRPQAGLPPFLLLYAGDEMADTRAQSEEFRAALARVGVGATTANIPNRDHYTIVQDIGAPGDPATQIMSAWMTGIFATPSAHS